MGDGESEPRDGTGVARLRFERHGGRTVLAECYARAPLHVSPPLAGTDGARLELALLTTGGGLLGAEQLSLQVDLGPGARAALRGVGALRLLPSGASCSQRLAILLAAGSSLTYLPEPLIPCAGARYRQLTTADIAPDATLIVGEVVTAGRLAHGERFAYHGLDLALRIRRDGRPLLVERLLLEPDQGLLPQLLGEHTHLASLAIAGPRADADLVRGAIALLRGAGLQGGASLPAPGLLTVRALGGQAHALGQALRAIATLAG